jgi:hypothetical protein
VYAELLASALRDGLGAPHDGELVEVLHHPGLIGDGEPPPPSAPHADHIRYAVTALAARGRGKLDIQGGRPAATWAWVFAAEGELELSPEPLDLRGDYSRDWTVSLDDCDAGAEADKLTALIHDERGRHPGDPLFVSFMEL